MARLRKTRLTLYSRALYPVGAFLVLLPTLDLAMRAYPLAPGNVEWRFGFFGVMFTSAGGVLIGLAILGLGGTIRHNLKVVRGVALLALIAAGITLIGSLVYFLDIFQIRSLAPDERQGAVLRTGVKAFLAAILGAATFLLLGIASWKASAGSFDPRYTQKPFTGPIHPAPPRRHRRLERDEAE